MPANNLTTEERKELGEASRLKGKDYELEIRKQLEDEGWIVSKNNNTVDLERQEIVRAKWNRFNPMTIGFPDFICFRPSIAMPGLYNLKFVECKSNGRLRKEEKEKIEFLRSRGFLVEVL